MAKISVDQVQAGMVLAAEVTDKRGRLLIPSGRALDEKHVQALKMWGIAQIEIEGDDPDEGGPEITPEALEQAQAIVADRLKNLPEGHEFTTMLTETLVPRVGLAIAEAQHVG